MTEGFRKGLECRGTDIKKNRMRIACIGGGTGLPLLLEALKDYEIEICAIVTTLDSGKSSGIIREEFRMPAPGDMRNCILALSDADAALKDIMRHRFISYIPQMSLGNLLFAAEMERHNSFEKAAERLSEIMKVKGKVYPATLENAHIEAVMSDGRTIEGEGNIIKCRKGSVRRIMLAGNNVKAYHKAAEAIRNADVIIIGPGGFYTSIMPHFLIEGIRDAYMRSKAKKILVQNIASQPGVIESADPAYYIKEIEKYTGGKNSCAANGRSRCIDAIAVSTALPAEKIILRYGRDGARITELGSSTRQQIARKGIGIIEGDFIDHYEIEKSRLLRHDGKRLAQAIMRFIFLQEEKGGLRVTDKAIH